MLDEKTVPLVSLNFLQSEGFEMEVFLFENIKNLTDEKMSFISAVYFIGEGFFFVLIEEILDLQGLYKKI